MARPDLKRYDDIPAITSGFRRTDEVDKVLAIMAEHDYGVFNRSAQLVDEILTDARIAGCFEQRMAALRACPLKFLPAGARRKDLRVAEQLGGVDNESGMWRDIVPTSTQDGIITWAVMLGVGVAEICWRREARAWIPWLRVWHPQFVRWDYWRRRFVLMTMEGEVELPRPDEEPNGDGKWLVFCPYGVEYGWRRGLLRSLAMLYLSRGWSDRDWDRHGEKLGIAIIKGQVPASSETDADRKFERKLQNIGNEPTIIVPAGPDKDTPGYDVNLVESAARTWESFKERKGDLNVDIAVRILGQDSTTEAKPVGVGGSGTSNSHTKVALDKTLMDAEFGPVVRAQCIRYWALFNYGDPNLAPWPTHEVIPAEDATAEAQALKALGEACSALILASDRVDITAILEAEGVPLITEQEAAAAAEEDAANTPPDPNAPPAGGDEADPNAPAPNDDQEGAGPGDDTEAASEKEALTALSRVALNEGGQFEEAQLRHLENAFGPKLMARAVQRYQEREAAAARALAAKKNAAENVRDRYQFAGFAIAVENPAGSIRMWTDTDGTKGSTRMQCDYGFIEGYLSGDGEDLDCYVGPNEDAAGVYIVHQLRAPDFKRHDEDKVMLGFSSADEARACYVAHRNDGERAIGGMSAMPVERFRAKLKGRAPTSTSKIRASQDLATALIALTVPNQKATALKRSVAGGRRAAKYQEALLVKARAAAARAMRPDLAALKAEIEAVKDQPNWPAALKSRLLARFGHVETKKLAKVIEKANILARLAGQHAALEEV